METESERCLKLSGVFMVSKILRLFVKVVLGLIPNDVDTRCFLGVSTFLLYSLPQSEFRNNEPVFEWRPWGHYLAVGLNNVVRIYDRRGRVTDELPQATCVKSVSWDHDGDVLAIINDGSTSVTLWEFATKKVDKLDNSTSGKEIPTFILWSHNSPVLAVGNSTGNLFLYNRRTLRSESFCRYYKTSVLGKHQRSITCGAFSNDDLLALGSSDASVSISNINGDSIFSFSCGADPSMIKFSDAKHVTDYSDTVVDFMKNMIYSLKLCTNSQLNSFVSAILGHKILVLVKLSDAENPIYLQFHVHYGNITSYCWFRCDLLLLGFSKGFFVCITTNPPEVGREIFSVQDFKTYLSSVCINESVAKIILAGNNQIRVRELNKQEEIVEIHEVHNEGKGLSIIKANYDGQLIAVNSISGMLYVFLLKLPMLAVTYRNTIAILSSLNEITLFREGEKGPLSTLKIDLEPTVIALGPRHIATAINTRVWFHNIVEEKGVRRVYEVEYLSTVIALLLNEKYVVAKLDGQAQLHRLCDENGMHVVEENGLIIPDSKHVNSKLEDVALTDNFLIYCTSSGHLYYYSLADNAYVSEYRHVVGITSLYPEPEGIRLCFFDERLDVYFYTPVDDSLLKIPSINSSACLRNCLWENFTVDRDTFVVCDSESIHVIIVNRNRIDNDFLTKVGITTIPFGHVPLMLCKGIVYCQTHSGGIGSILLDSHRIDTMLEGKSSSTLESLLNQSLSLGRWSYAWKICEHINKSEHWRKYAVAAMKNGEVNLAIRVFKQIDAVGIVWNLEAIRHVEEKNLLYGHLSLLLENYDLAEKFFLQSSKPTEALDMRRDLLEWDKALILAKRLSPEEMPKISKEFAQHLEGHYTLALEKYENGLIENLDDSNEQLLDHNELCNCGIARMCIHTGNIRRGIEIAANIKGRAVKRDCAIILEHLRQFNDAAYLYELGHFYDQAAAASLKAKNWTKVGDLLDKVQSPKIHSLYGKVMEEEKKYMQAALAYKNARDYHNLVRILLDHLNRPEEAVRIIRENRNIEGAKLIAKFFTKLGDFELAVQFLVISQCHQEAYNLAEMEQKMDVFADAIENEGLVDVFLKLAGYYAKNKNMQKAGHFYYKAGHYSKALDYLLTNEENAEAVETAIECVSQAKDPNLSSLLVSYLLGEADGVPKNPKFLFKYYISMRMYKEAAKTGVIIAAEEQMNGSYRLAHDLLLEMYREMQNKKIKVPFEIQNNLMLLHSYLIIKNLVKRYEHKKAARMLIRVANSVSHFPTHIAPILTSAVIECSKAGLKQSAFKFAVQLLKESNRKNIDERYRRKIEAIVRKSDKLPDPEETKTPCPYCENETEESSLVCMSCKNLIPYCIVTGLHIITDDYSVCPSCNFPAFYSELKK
ncbi:unnamed protein product [Thelazia callipaeda]|uniref:WD_REPEATS_REGION domain-containing protein n=1 Tax=Thelazia callipaeda TaxID=103827 RepID=A0A0N5CVI9_THECL|nr:unnamed protein product [Thelazia callipaeda]